MPIQIFVPICACLSCFVCLFIINFCIVSCSWLCWSLTISGFLIFFFYVYSSKIMCSSFLVLFGYITICQVHGQKLQIYFFYFYSSKIIVIIFIFFFRESEEKDDKLFDFSDSLIGLFAVLEDYETGPGYVYLTTSSNHVTYMRLSDHTFLL